jgi:RNA polymerase sigma-70 factor (ECF subfamily)
VEADEEAELVHRVAAGDRVAFHRLVTSHQRPLSAYARRMVASPQDADDIVQETLLRLWTRADRFDATAARLTTWLHRVAHNLCIDAQRRSGRLQPLEAGEETAGHASPEAEGEQTERQQWLQQALARLPERQRSALLLCHYQGLSNREAGEVLGVGVEALESLLSRARRQLRREAEQWI